MFEDLFHLHVKRVRPTKKKFFPASLTQYSCAARALALQQSLIVMTTIIRETLQHGVGIHAVVSIPSICLSSYSHCVEETDLVQPSAAAALGSRAPRRRWRRHRRALCWLPDCSGLNRSPFSISSLLATIRLCRTSMAVSPFKKTER